MNNNYKLIEQRHVDDVEGEVFLLEHIKSGAKVLKIANSDTNKTFCITFKTEPDDEYRSFIKMMMSIYIIIIIFACKNVQ